MTASNKELIEQYAAVLKAFEESVQTNHQTLLLSNNFNNFDKNKKEKTILTTGQAPQPGKKSPPA